jgi:hypothetical protein
MAFISQKTAKLMLRREAGYSVALAKATVESLPKTRDGKRLKIKTADVYRLIAEAQKPSPIPTPKSDIKFRPFRREIRQQLGKI